MQNEPLPYRRRKLMSEINVVPYIDVMLVLLIIFMVTAPLLQQGIQVELPKTSNEPLPSNSDEPIILSVNADGDFFLNIAEDAEQAISLQQVERIVKTVLKQKPEASVFVRGDNRIKYGVVVNAMSILRQAGAPNVGLITEQE